MRGPAVFALACCVAAAGAVAHADVVRLHAGGEIRGKVVKTSAARATDQLAVETLTGATVNVPRDTVSFVIQRPLAVEEYETRLRHLPDTLEAHWRLADWCKSKSLLEQRKTHLQRVVEIDPDHEPAHLALGHVWKDGGWVDWDEYMTARGYVKHKGKWVTQQELDLIEKSAAELKREQEWYPKLKLWTGWLASRDAERARQGLLAIRAIQDDDAAPAVQQFLGGSPVRDLRLLGVEVLTRAAGLKSAKVLVRVVLRDNDPEVRHHALEGIGPAHFEAAQALFLKELRNENNAVVCRAGRALSRVGDERSIPQLIESLVTSHRYEVRVPGNGSPTYSFGADGSLASASGVLPPDIEAGLRTGQFPNGVVVLNTPTPGAQLQQRTVLVRTDHQNAEVLATLQKLTDENFGYDERLWRLWWAAKKAQG